jgi:hypothetical protein
MSLRRFLYLVANDCGERYYSLRRIDTSRFFFRESTEGIPTPLDSGGAGAADPSAIKDGGCLPDPTINLFPPLMDPMVTRIGFVLFKNDNEEMGRDQVVAIDNLGHSLICDPAGVPPAVGYMRSLASPKFSPFSLTVGNSLYVMDARPSRPNGHRKHSFEVFTDDNSFKGWNWSPLDPPPLYDGPSHHSPFINSYTVVGGSNIVISNKSSKQTFCFNTVNKKWSKVGDWALPFYCLAEYLPDHKLWFGISQSEEGYRFCGANLVASSDSDEMRKPMVHSFWKEYAEPAPEWGLTRAYAVHLGFSKFCIIRFFEIGKLHLHPEGYGSYMREEEIQAVITGVEVESCGEEVRVLKHKSERYKLDLDSTYRVL